MAARDLEAEVIRLRRRIAALMDEATTNERLLKKTQQRELELLGLPRAWPASTDAESCPLPCRPR